MIPPAIEVRGLAKLYTLQHEAGKELLSEKLGSGFRRLLRRESSAQTTEAFWALRDVSFDIRQGEVVGIVGRNGAGKSTLLKILSRITEPTAGSVRLRGRVASLLEVGTGFHPELTGRENVFLNGAILGMSRAEINQRFDAIVAFAEVEKFLDTPVKRYSSGMYVRLAFAVAAHLDPEILIVDEVLAVGDAQFQKKCLGRMNEVARSGRTVLIVSHNLTTVQQVCQKVIWLAKGRVVEDGPATSVLTRYASEGMPIASQWSRPPAVPVKRAGLLSAALRAESGEMADTFRADEPIRCVATYQVNEPLTYLQNGVRIYNSQDQVVFSSADSDRTENAGYDRMPGRYRASFVIPARLLVPDKYRIQWGIHSPMREVYDVVEAAFTFQVTAHGSLAARDGRLGLVAPFFHWDTEPAADALP